jgi:serine/threonine-protein kinase
VRVFAGNKALGMTPLRRVALPAGTTRLALRSASPPIDQALTVALTAGEETVREIEFGQGSVQLLVKPWADVFVDGAKVGITPMPPLKLFEGTHRIKLVNGELNVTRTVTVTVVKDEVQRVKVDLTAPE